MSIPEIKKHPETSDGSEVRSILASIEGHVYNCAIEMGEDALAKQAIAHFPDLTDPKRDLESTVTKALEAGNHNMAMVALRVALERLKERA